MPGKQSRRPAHQNTFAYRHNPNSKKTQQILASPNVHVCRRCHDKIEWRKQYRKYKPRTQPGKCTSCQRKNVTAAYHTICETCTRTSPKARSLLEEWNLQKSTKGDDKVEEPGEENTAAEQSPANEEPTSVDPQDEDSSTQDDATPSRVAYRRVCAICVKEPALPGESEEDEDDVLDEKLKNLDRPLKLRERKRLERLAEKKSTKRRPNRSSPQEGDDGDNEEQEEDDIAPETREQEDDDDDDEEDDVNDPLVQAVGGADQLLTGEAYQAKLLKQAAES